MRISKSNLTKKQGFFILSFLLFSLALSFSAFRLFASSVPTITALSVNYGSTSGGTSVTITGTNFISTPTVTFGGTSASSVTFTSATSITATTPAHVSGIVDVVLTNPDTGTVTLSRGFVYANTVINSNTTWSSNQNVSGIVITNNATLTVNNSVTVTNSGPVFFTNTTTGGITLVGTATVFGGTDFEVRSGTASFDVNKSIASVPTFTSLKVNTGAILTHAANTTSHVYSLIMSVSGDANILGSINLDGKGFAGGAPAASGSGPGGGAGGSGSYSGVAYGGGGGGHGGTGGYGYIGGNGTGGTGGINNDSLVAPVLPGSGGGGARNTNGAGGAVSGGAGGGALKLVVSGTTTVTGTITAAGSAGGYDGNSGYSPAYSGGGAGGSIWVQTATLAGAGSIKADGGADVGSNIGGSGAGGRIVLSYTTNSSTIAKTTYGGTGYQNAAPGTIYQKSSGQTNFDVIIDNGNTNVAGASTAWTAADGTMDNFTVKNATISGTGMTIANNFNSTGTSVITIPSVSIGNDLPLTNGTLNAKTLIVGHDLTISASTILAAQVLQVTNNVTINSTGTLTHDPGYTSGLQVTATNLTVNSGGAINLDGKGYAGGAPAASGAGPGGGAGGTGLNNSVAYGGGGGGHGGAGGVAYIGSSGSGGAGGVDNDSLAAPILLGSGGGGASNTYGSGGFVSGGAGGGALKLVVSGTTTVAGTITAAGSAGGYDGNSGYSPAYSGGGAGGSIWVQTATLAGAGSIKADGGADAGNKGGGGAGGRVTLGYSTSTFSGTKTAFGGTGYQGGSPGTVFTKLGSANGDLLITNNNIDGATNTQSTGTNFTFDNVTFGKYTKYIIPSTSTLTVANSLLTPSATFATTSLTINSGGVLNLPTTTTVSNLTITNNGTVGTVTNLTLSGDTFYQNGTLSALMDLTVGSSTTFEFQNLTASTAFNLSNLTIQNGGVVTHKTNTTTQSNMLNLNIANNLNIQSGGSINLDGKGFVGGTGNVAGSGSGGGAGANGNGSGVNIGGGGGGHGGKGGNGIVGSGGAKNDSLTAPVILGSGGGGGYNNSYPAYSASGGAGGGAVKIVVGGTTTVAGSISATGTVGAATGYYAQGGGGSGGSVWIQTNSFVGAGSIAANGGNAPVAGGGGGGGGIVAITYNSKIFSGPITVTPGTGYQAGEGGTSSSLGIFTLTYTAGANGTVTGTSPQTVNQGQNGTTVTAVPNTGYHFVNWSDSSVSNPRTDNNVQGSITVTANFAINTYTLAYTPGTGGTITGTTPQTVNYGASGTAVTAVPSVGHYFINWSDGIATTSRTDTNVMANKSVTANFGANTYTVTYTAGANGTLSGTSPQTISYGSNGTAVSAVPSTGYHFVNWSDASTQNPRTDTNVTANISVTANFAINVYALTYSAGTNGSISGTSPQTVNHGSDGTAVTAVPNANYHFTSWSDGVLTATRTDTNVQNNITVTANFLINTFTLTYTAGANGTLAGTSPQTVNYGASGTAVTANPATGYHFTSWSDGILTAARTDTNVTANKSVTANFAINTFTLTYTAGAGGSLTGTTPQTVNYGDSGTAITAVPTAGYYFVNWSDSSTNNPRTDTNVTANKSVTANFVISTYTLTYTAGANGTLTGTSPQTINYGASGTAVTANPAVGYHFVNWSDGSTQNPRTDTNVTANKSVTANFAVTTFTLTYTAGANGTITGTSPQTINYGANGTAVSAIPSTGYHFVNWSDSGTVNPRTDTNVQSNITITATFAINTYTLTYTAGANGTISGTSPQTVNYGASGSAVTANPATGYHFVNWSDGSTQNPRTDTSITANKSVTANFAINTYTLTYAAGANGTLTGTSPQTVNHGSNGTAVTANPSAGYHFVNWSDSVATATRTDLNVQGNITVTANFAINILTLTYTAGTNGAITGTSPQTINYGENGTTVTAVPNTGYHFVNWSDSSTNNPRTDTNVQNNITVTASFAINTYTLTYAAGTNGTISGTSPQTINYGANGTAVTANPSIGYHFVNWSDGGVANPRTDTNVTANKSVTANFAINSYTLTYTAGTNGTITGTSPQTVNHGANGTAVSAIPSVGYHFVNWSDGSTQNPRTDSNVQSNVTVTGNFAINTYTLTYTAGTHGALFGVSPQTVNSGSNGTAVNAIPNTGYNFVNWSDGSTTNPRTDMNVIANISVTANFAINTYTLTYSAGANGTISGTSLQTVGYGANGTAVTANPAAGYHFVNWSDNSTQNPRADTNVQNNITVTANFAINIYTLTYTAGSNGTIVGTSPQTVNHGQDGTVVTATANANYHFVNWSDGILTATRTDTNVQGNITVTANFAIDTYTLTYTAGANGNISGISPQTVNHGANGTAVTANPAIGYHFVDWSDSSTQNPRTDTNVTSDISVAANFAVTTYTLTYTAGANGTITGTSPQTVNYGANGTSVTAVPAIGYHFINWSDNSTQNPRIDLNVQNNLAVTANFAIDAYTLTYTAGTNGTIVGTTPQTVSHGADGTAVTATPNVGYHFTSWSDGILTATRTDTNITSNITVTASFAISTYTLTYAAGANGAITGTSPQTVNHGANGTAVTASPATGYHFVSWSDSSTQNPRTDLNVQNDITVSASFAINVYTLTYTAGTNGTITGTSPQTVTHGQDATAVTAAPDAGYHFVGWSDGVLTSTRTDLNVHNNITVTANFSNTLTLTYAAGPNGTITGTTPQTVNYGADGTAVTATPSAGHHFVNWSDNSIQNPRTDTNVHSNITVTANFAVTDYTLTYTAGSNGTISGDTSQTVHYGANGTAISATANAGYHFINWSDGSTQNPRTDTNVSNNINVTANFSSALTLTYVAGANGSINGTASQTVTQNGSGSEVTAAPKSGYRFVNWSDGKTSASRTDSNITTDLTVTANFAVDAFTLKYKSDSHGKIDGDTTQTVSYGDDGSTVKANPDTGYQFKRWSDGKNDDSRKDKNIQDDLTVTAEFEKQEYTLTFKAGANGSIDGDETQKVNYDDDGSLVRANPDSGYRFKSWSDGSTANPRKETSVRANLSVTAEFELEKVTYSLNYAAGSNGSITGDVSQTVNDGEDGSKVTADPVTGYHFVSWSDDSTDNPRADVNVKKDIRVTASFASDVITNNTAPVNDQNNQPTSPEPEKKEILSNMKENPDENITSTILPIIPSEQQAPATAATVAALAAGLLYLAYQLGSARNVLLFMRDLPLGALGLFAKYRKKKNWGTIYDSKTGDPIPFVSISVIDANDGKVKESKLTDKYGSYYFLVPKGEYQLEIKKRGYELENPAVDAKVYYSNVLTDSDKKKLVYLEPDMIAYDICLKSTNPDQRSAKDKHLSRFFFSSIFYLGFALSIAIYLSNPTKLNLVLIIIYFINIVIRNLTYLEAKWGHVFSRQGVNQPFSSISLLDRNTKQLVARTISDEQGRYVLLANQGDYILKTISNVGQFSEKEEELSLAERGVVKKKIVV